MTRETVIAAWAAKCKEAEATGPGALRIVEAALLKAMLDIEAQAQRVQRLQDAVTLPDPKHGTTRAHGVHLMCPQTGKLIAVDVDYEADEDTGIVPLYVWAGAHDISGWMRPLDEDRLADQIAARIKEDAAEQRAETRAELRDAA